MRNHNFFLFSYADLSNINPLFTKNTTMSLISISFTFNVTQNRVAYSNE